MDHCMTVEGLLVQAPGERLRIILEPYCLDFEIEELLEAEELPLPPDLIEGKAIPARVKLKSGARLLQISLADSYRDVLWKRRTPFALATQSTPTPEKPEMKRREVAFLAARGLGEAQS